MANLQTDKPFCLGNMCLWKCLKSMWKYIALSFYCRCQGETEKNTKNIEEPTFRKLKLCNRTTDLPNHSSLIFFSFEQTLIHSRHTVRRNTCWAAMELSKRIDNQISTCNELSQFEFDLFRKSQASNGPRHLQPFGCNFKPSNAQVAALSQFLFIVSIRPQHLTTTQADATFPIKASVGHVFKVHQMRFTGETLSISDVKIPVQSRSVGMLELSQNNRIQSLGPPLQEGSVVKTSVEDGE